MSHPQQQVTPHLIDETVREWMAAQEHTASHVQSLRLKYGLKEPYYSAIAQIAAKVKYPRKFQGLPEHWLFPAGQALEQSSSVQTALYKSSFLSTPYFADLCAGMGIDTWAFASKEMVERGLCFEVNPELARLLEHNLSNTTVLAKEADLNDLDRWIRALNIAPADLTIYLDPDRRAAGKRTFGIDEGTPNLLDIQKELLERCSKVIAKHSPMLDLNATVDLHQLSEIIIVQRNGECKEVLTIQQAEADTNSNPTLSVIELDTEERLVLDRNNLRIDYTENWEQYLIQPQAGLSKSQAHTDFAASMGWKSTPYGNLYTSSKAPQPSSHYRVYEIIEEAGPYRLSNVPERGAVECIGFPETADKVRKKLKLKEGATQKVYALRSGKKKSMILCRRVN